ncbi:Exocyst complex component EXO84B [Dissostichus eleginoides]|uniref:Exocyst complex component EXO84B n=1 Tax=Dissostichus eleginoides TaxID=100907 RepID=A0AAD9BRT7_DISEL|nr:Exocyst complex component EXO84B [Dissostichus eleginoides]
MPEPQFGQSEWIVIDKGNEKTDSADEAITSSQTVSTIILGDSNLTSATEEITSGTDKVKADADSMERSDGEKESIMEEGLPQQSFSTSDNLDEDTERQNAFRSQMEDNDIVDEEKGEDSVEAMVSPVQQNVKISDEQAEVSTEENASCMSSRVDHTLTSDDNINDPEVEEESLEEGMSSIEQNGSIIDHQDEFIEGEAVSGKSSCLEDPLVSEESNDDEETGDISVEAMVSPVHQHFKYSDDQGEGNAEGNATCMSSREDHNLISDDIINVPDEEEESFEEGVLSIHENVSITEPQAEAVEGEAVSGRRPLEDPFISEYNNVVEEELSTAHQMSSISDEDSVKEDASNTVQVEDS